SEQPESCAITFPPHGAERAWPGTHSARRRDIRQRRPQEGELPMSTSEAIQIPPPAPRGLPDIDTRELERDLAAEVDGEVRFDPGSRGAYATDASNYRQVPIGVVVPRSVDAAAAAVAVC